MHRVLLIAAFAFAVSSPAQAETKSKVDKPGGNDEQTLMQLEQKLVDALVGGNMALWDHVLANTFVFSAPDGTTQNKAQWTADVRSGALKLESSKNDDMKVWVYGSSAVVSYRSTDKGTYKGNDISGNYRWTDVFVKRHGGWQLVATQGTGIAKK